MVVLITGGKDSGDATYTAANNAATTATSFLSVTGGGVTKRVPIVVVGVKPNAADVASLQTIATNSGGVYRSATTAFEVNAAVDYAVQLGFARSAEFDAGTASEFLPVSPIVGTVNLKNAKDVTGGSLPNTDINSSPGGRPLAAAQQHDADRRVHPPGIRRSVARVQDVQTGGGFDQADRVEVRQ